MMLPDLANDFCSKSKLCKYSKKTKKMFLFINNQGTKLNLCSYFSPAGWDSGGSCRGLWLERSSAERNAAGEGGAP